MPRTKQKAEALHSYRRPFQAWTNANISARYAAGLGSLYAAPQSRTSADGLTECTRQMGLIKKSARAGNLRESLVGGQEQVLSPFDAPPKQPTVWRVTGRLSESASEVTRR